MNKKITKIIVSCVAVGLIGSCFLPLFKKDKTGESIPEGVTTVLKVSAFNGGYGLGWLAALKEAYEKKHPEVYISYPANIVDRDAQMTEIRGGIYKYDLYFTGFGYHSEIYQYKRNFYSLDDVMEKIGDNVITESVVDWMTFEDGSIYSLPWATGLGGILYHEDYFKKHNIAIPNTTNELLAVADRITTIRNGASTGYAYNYSYLNNYTEYLYNCWLAQYEGVQGYENYYNFIGTNGVVGDQSWLFYNGTLRTLEVYEQLLNPQKDYALPHSRSDDFTSAQFRFLDKQAVMMINGDWVIQEMMKGEFDVEETKDVCIMKTPIISSIVETMELWEEESGVVYTDLTKDQKAEYDAKLSAIVSSVDAGIYDSTLCSESDFNRVKEARSVVPSLANFHNAVVPKSAKYPDAAKDFLAFMYSEEGISLYLNSVYGAGLPVQYSDAQVAQIRQKSRFYDTVYAQLNKDTYYAFNTSTNARSSAFVKNGLGYINGLTNTWWNYLLATPGTKEYKSAKTIYGEHIIYTTQQWSRYTKNLT